MGMRAGVARGVVDAATTADAAATLAVTPAADSMARALPEEVFTERRFAAAASIARADFTVADLMVEASTVAEAMAADTAKDRLLRVITTAGSFALPAVFLFPAFLCDLLPKAVPAAFILARMSPCSNAGGSKISKRNTLRELSKRLSGDGLLYDLCDC
jgi:hypothetical protein